MEKNSIPNSSTISNQVIMKNLLHRVFLFRHFSMFSSMLAKFLSFSFVYHCNNLMVR